MADNIGYFRVMNIWSWLVFIISAALEVGGDALIRKGFRGGGLTLIVAGFCALGCYGLVVNTVPWDFSKLLGAYVAVFAVVSVIVGRVAFGEVISPATWLGLGLICLGGLIIQSGLGGKS